MFDNVVERLRQRRKSSWVVPFALVACVIAAIMLINSDLEHIEDKNGPDDHSPVSITDAQIIANDMGSMGSGSATSFKHPNRIKFLSKKFTGVTEILYANIIGKGDFVLSIYDFVVTEGNLKMVVVNEDKIIAVIEPGEEIDILIEDISGYVSLRIAGESAAYSFFLNEFEYNSYSHQ